MRQLAFCVFAFSLLTSFLYSDEIPCAFCNQEVLDYQMFYENDLVRALYTHKPILPGHCLIIPKRHAERFEDLSDKEMAQIFQVIKKVDTAASHVFGTSAYLLLQKNGYEVGQTVPHVHFHYIPRQTDDSSTIKFILKMFIVNIQSPISSEQMYESVEKMKLAMENQDENRDL